MKNIKPRSIRFSEALLGEIKKTSEAVSMAEPEVMRQSIWLGLPILKKKFGKKK